jgi:ubiquinone/menaquinone biosynthesis C-methylase UbiE
MSARRQEGTIMKKKSEEWRDYVEVTRQGIAEDFGGPTDLPSDPDQASVWQAHNRSWWERNPMRYDFERRTHFEEGSLEFYREVDGRLFRSAREAFPWKKIPFDNFIDYGALASARVLEIGVGIGIHAELLARHARSYVGVDLTEYATKSTTRRFELLGLKGSVLRMDAEQLEFPDASFDFVWSWGVIHHSANTRRILEQVHRVLRPGGKFVAMVYHRSFFNNYVRGGLYYGVLRGGFLRGRSVHNLVQETTDGAIARFYTVPEWEKLVGDLFQVASTRLIGHKTQLVPLPYGVLKEAVARLIPNALGRTLTNRPAMAYMLVACMERRASEA